jgi:hypothetical protein
MRYYLVETYSPSLKFEDDGNEVIALTPLACYELDKAGIKHSILEDHYDEGEFLRGEQAYYMDQLSWFDRLDNFLLDMFPEARTKHLRLGSSRYFDLKKMVDSCIVRCKAVDMFMRNVKPDSIRYISATWSEDSLTLAEYPLLFRTGQSLFSRIMPMFCKKYDVDFERTVLGEAALSGIVHTVHGSIGSRVRRSLGNAKYVRELWHTYTTFSIRGLLPRRCTKCKWSVLFLKTPSFVRDIIQEMNRAGHKVYCKRGHAIIKDSFPNRKTIRSIYANVCVSPEYSIGDLAKAMEQFGMLSWVDKYCGVNISTVLMPRFLYFVDVFCPQLVSLIDAYVAFYNDNQIDMVVTPHMVSVDEYAAIMAARYAEKTTSICLQHGDSVFALKTWDLSEYLPYDIYLTTNDEEEAYIKTRSEIAKLDTSVFQYPNRFNLVPKARRSTGKGLARKRTVVFVPTMYTWDNIFWSEVHLPSTWYFAWHKEVIAFFGLRDAFTFIWKGIPASNATYDPSPDIINDARYGNIRYATEPFTKWIRKADMVLLDYPSTALYEAAVSGVPVMSLYFKPFTTLRESALRLFGSSLQPFSSFAEGIARIDKFLQSDLRDFVVEIPHSTTPVLETLERLRRNKRYTQISKHIEGG